jgi:hypothetical protein
MARIGALVVVIAVALFFWLRPDELDPVAVYQEALDVKQRGELEAAIGLLETIPADHRLYADAQQEIALTREEMTADEAREETRMADNLYGVLIALRKDHVDGPGPAAPYYSPNCRYMLKRTAEFIERYPDDPRAVELRGWFPYYAKVASLDKPPTEEDVRTELRFRISLNQFSDALQAVEEFAATGPEAAPVVEELEARLVEEALAEWERTRTDLEEDGSLTPGQENWLRVRYRVQRYLDNVAGLAGVSDAAEALRDRADQALAQGG